MWAVEDKESRQIICHALKLLQSSLKVFNNLTRDFVGRGQVVNILKAFIPQPENIQIQFVAGGQFFIGKSLEPLCLLALLAVAGMVALCEVVQILALQGVCFQGKVHVGAKVVNPGFLRPRILGFFAQPPEKVYFRISPKSPQGRVF
jgi:hypothetical protein